MVRQIRESKRNFQRHVEVLQSLLNVPTAPYHEQAVIEQVKSWAQAQGIVFAQDPAGNVVLRYRRGKGGAHWVYAAHLDHPGFVVRKRVGKIVHAEFLGNVQPPYFVGSRVRFFGPKAQALATVLSVKKAKTSPFLQCRLELRQIADLPAETIGMWDLPPMILSNGKLKSRGCDDVVGSAAVLCAMEDIVAGKFPCEVTGLLTRAEEVGFIGALGACKHGTIPKDSLVVAIETSKAQPGGPLGSGVVVRVGDSIRTFDPSLTAHVSSVAAGLSKTDKQFRHTRQLMPGGATESSAYMVMGYQATGLCLPLGNYHNQGPRGKIAAEIIHFDDFESLVKLLVGLAANKGTVQETEQKLRLRLQELIDSRGGYL